jgi:Mu-like prophage DNA circulation protein
MSWRTKASWSDELYPASFRGVPFEVDADDGSFGRRGQLFEFPKRDKPAVEDMGRAARTMSLTAYVIGKDWMSKRDKLVKAIEQFGPGKLVHPFYGTMTVSIIESAKVSHSSSEGRMCRISFSFVETGEFEFPTVGRATRNKLFNSNSALADYLNNLFSGFSISGLPDFAQSGILADVSGYMDTIDEAFTMLDSGVSAASRLLKGDLSVIFSGSNMTFVTRLQSMWRSANRLSSDSKSLLKLIKGLSSVSLGYTSSKSVGRSSNKNKKYTTSGLFPRGVWKTSSESTRKQVQKSNQISQVIRISALSTAAYVVTLLPSQPQKSQTTKSSITKPQKISTVAVSDTDTTTTTVYPSYAELKELRVTLNTALDKELSRITDDGLFLALQQVRTDINMDIADRLATATKTINRTPADVFPAVVLAYQWFGDASRADEITQRNDIAHPGFVPATALIVAQE